MGQIVSHFCDRCSSVDCDIGVIVLRIKEQDSVEFYSVELCAICATTLLNKEINADLDHEKKAWIDSVVVYEVQEGKVVRKEAK